MPRYFVEKISDEEAAGRIATQALADGKRVLWVVNTVARCQRIAKSLGALCYHSRFRLMDRKNRHQEVVCAFQGKQCPTLALTTQVCEMSLDLDADVLISEFSPITSMIQRMGRCNRHARPGKSKTGKVFLYEPENNSPYNNDDLTGVDLFVESIDGKSVSQSFLQELLERLGPAKVEVSRYAAFLESGPWAQSREESLREENDFTIQAVLDGDLETFLHLKRSRKDTAGFVVPVPARFGAKTPDSRLGPYCAVVPSSHYHELYGFFNEPLEV
jgi:CRISPR-associated endonuclease/helicase Cas3